MEPHINPLDKLLFYKYLDKATNYMEFGSGGSTYQASIRPNIKNITVVESDMVWINTLKAKILHPSINFNHIDIESIPNSWGNPGKGCSKEKMKKYSDVKVPEGVDMILIDGRFRVACCLKVFEQIGNDGVIAFDDFLNRKEYHIVLDYYTIMEQTSDKCLVILKKKDVLPPSLDIINKYEVIAN
jgi:hypothetical protein